jgi:hypothetical protein
MKAFFKTLSTILFFILFQQSLFACYLPVESKVNTTTDTTKQKKTAAVAPYGLVNIFNNPVPGAQVAAIGNITRDRSTGFQCSGIFNTAAEHHGAQVAGIINTAGKSSGIQIGGIINRLERGNSTQLAGLINSARSDSSGNESMQPLQVSGLVNTSYGATTQIAGIGNISSSEAELEVAGIFNNCSSNSGVQVAGIVNSCTENKGAQIAGIVNRCTYFKGVQVGLVNIADSSRGVQVGLINIVRHNGYLKLEISGDEMFYANIGLRSGVRRLHGIASVGMKPDDLNGPLWNTGLGMGTMIAINGRTSLSIDAMHYQIYYGHHCGENYLTRLNVGIDHMISSKISLYGGLTFNLLITDDDDARYTDTYSTIDPYHFTEFNWFGDNVKPWVGLKVGLRLF